MMKTFPLVRNKWTNEHYMAWLFAVLLIYQFEKIVINPKAFFNFVIIIIFAMIVETLFNIFRHKELKCAVSGTVTSAIISTLAVDVPLWGTLACVFCALLVGKHLWGGTGKNIFNPAVVGLLMMRIMFGVGSIGFQVSIISLFGILLSLIFIKFRPFVSLSVIAGMFLGLYIQEALNYQSIISSGIFFWGCIVYTDPVTILDNRKWGAILGFTAGVLSITLNSNLILLEIVLIINLLSYFLRKSKKNWFVKSSGFHPIKYKSVSNDLMDFTFSTTIGEMDISHLTSDEIIERIRVNEVFGMGGAAFPTYRKLLAAKEAKVIKKYFIINAVECDPGLVHDKWLLNNRFYDINKGIDLICQCIDFDEVHLAVKSDFELPLEQKLSIKKINNFFPAGEERTLIYELLNVRVAKDIYPTEIGILVLNIQTVLAIYEAVYHNHKVNSRYITVANLYNSNASTARVVLNSNIQEVAKSVFKSNGCVFAGGGIMQSFLTDDLSTLDKQVNFIAFSKFPKYKESIFCLNCGLCNRYCPANLDVRSITESIDSENIEKALKLNIEECIGCGLCSYHCLAGKNISNRIELVKPLT